MSVPQAVAFEPDAVLINLGQNDYGCPAHDDPKTGKPTRVRFQEKDGKKVRVAVKSGETIDG